MPWGFGALSFLVCLIGAWQVSLWTDEAVSISAATRGLPQLFELLKVMDIVHAAYYLVLHGWIELFGLSPLSVRAPSALAAGLTTVATVAIARRLGPARLVVAVGVVMTVLPRVTWMGIEARPFAFSAALAATSTLVLLMLLQRDGRRRLSVLALYALVSGLGVAVNIYVALVVVAHGVVVFMLRRRLTGWWMVSAALAAVMSAPVVVISLGQRGQIVGVQEGPLGWLRQVLVNQWLLGDTPTGPGVDDLKLWWQAGSLALAALCWSLALWGLWRARKHSRGSVEVWLQVVSWTSVVIPTAIILVGSLGSGSLYNARYFSMSAWAFALLVGAGIAAVGSRWKQVVALVLIVVFALPVYVSQRGTDAKSGTDWQWVATEIAEHARSGDGVYFAPRRPDVHADTFDQTMRRIAESYPQSFAGLRDLTLVSRGVDDGSLDGTSRSLERSFNDLESVNVVWEIRRKDDPANAVAHDHQVLSEAGFTADASSSDRMTSVTRWERDHAAR